MSKLTDYLKSLFVCFVPKNDIGGDTFCSQCQVDNRNTWH